MSSATLAAASEVRPSVRIGPPRLSAGALVSELRSLWQFRDLFLALTAHRMNVRYKQSVLGVSWAILQPLSLMLLYTTIMSWLSPSTEIAHPVFAYSAILLWTSFSNALGGAINSLVGHANLVTKVFFPREILPLTYVAIAVIDFLLASTVLVGLMAYYGVPVGTRFLLTAPLFLLVMVFAAGVALLLSALQVRMRDIGVALPLVLQLWMFASPVFYTLDMVPPHARPWYVLNPMAGFVDTFRRLVTGDAGIDSGALAIGAIVSLLLLPLSYVCFKRVEATMADVV